jgi:uncharacterized lipoprotein YajG
VTVNGTSVASGSASPPINLNVGANTITVVVTAPDGSTTKTYTVTVTRAASSVATLSNLTLSNGTLSPAFASGTTGYSASVPLATTSVTVTPTTTDANATVTVNGTSVASGAASPPINLNVGANTITVVVTAQDGSTTKTYTVTVTRAIPADSERARAIQNSVTPIVAQTSGQSISSAIAGAIGDAFGGGGQFFSFGPSGLAFNFAADPRMARSDAGAASANARVAQAQDAFAGALGYARMPTKAPVVTPPAATPWSLWLDVRGTGWKVTDAENAPTLAPAADVNGRQVNVTAGLGYKLTPDLLLGLVGGGEAFKYDVTSLDGSLKGDGGSIGG